MVQLLIPDGASKALLFPLVNPDAPTVSMATPDPGSYIWSSTTFFHSFLAHLNAGANILAWASQTDRVCCAGIGENGKIYGVVEIFSDRNSILECEEFLVYYLRLATLALRQIAILQAQRISEEQFQIIAVNSPHPISIIDQNGRYIYLNPRFSELFGYTLDDVPDGKTWFIKAFPDFSEQRRARELWKKDLASSSPGMVRPRQFCVRCKDGQLLEILFLSMMMSNGNHIVIYRDMTPVFEAVQKQSLFNGLFLSSHDAIFSVTPDGRVLSWNPAAERIYGYPAGEIEGKDIAILEPPHLKGEVHRILKKVIEGVPLVNYETQRIRRDGKVIDVSLTTSPILNDKGDIVGASTIARDISRKKAEERLKRGAVQYQECIGDINVGVYRSTGDPEGRIAYGNTSLLDILGFESLERLKDIPVSSLFAEEGGRIELLADLKRDGFVKNRELHLYRPDGRLIHVRVTAIATFNPDQTVDFINGIVEDITYMRSLEERVTTLRA